MTKDEYHALKKQHDGSIVMMKRGDFYETMFEDAVAVAVELDLAVCRKIVPHTGETVPTCGLPVHRAQQWIDHLRTKGHVVKVLQTP